MSKLFQTLVRSIRHPQNSGQAIIVLALGFIGLVGFVGIVTDVSILLARYNTLSRAVDSAAISAAGQMRSDRSFGEVGLAARMMLEIHGINSNEVMVETCASSNGTDPTLCNEANRYRKLVRVGAKIMSPTVFLRLLGIEDIELSAVSTSETAVLDIVMIMDVSESMLLDTTYKDWADIGFGQVYVPPAINSGHDNTIMGRAEAQGRFASDPNDYYVDEFVFWGEDLLGGVNGRARIYPYEVDRRLYYVDASTGVPVANPNAASANPIYRVESFPYPGSTGTQQHPRTACRVRFWPYSATLTIPDHLRNMSQFWSNWEDNPSTRWNGFIPTYDFYGCCNDPTNGGAVLADGRLTTLPGYSPGDFAAESGDFRFNDLICQPIKEARDAAREFLNTIDFERGDRVAFVTFDRGAFLIDPDGSDGRDASTNTDTCPRDPEPVEGRTAWTHMSASLCRAERTLDEFIGVRAEPNFYSWKQDGGGWEGFARGLTVDGRSLLVDYYGQGASGGYASTDRSYNDYPVKDFCPFHNAALINYTSLYSLWDWDYTYNNPSNPYGTAPNAAYASRPGLYRIMTPNPTDAGWGDIGHNQSYELWASCRGTNIGAGLREGNNALLDPTTTRRAGTVWVMIMLSDGAAGASDPVRLNGRKPLETNPYYDYGADRASWQSYAPPGLPIVHNLIRYGSAGEYGAFGLCPIGTPTERTRLTQVTGQVGFPYCGDTLPESRHFCLPQNSDPKTVGVQCPSGAALGYGFAPGSYDIDYDCSISFDENLLAGRVYDVDIGNFPNQTASECDPLYDVDDYARDWADYVSLSRTGAGDEQLPTIFAIGFGLDFRIKVAGGSIDYNEDPSSPAYVPGSAEYNTADFLGEELLRYIADVGDNFQVDTDYQQDWRQDRILQGYLNGSETFGPRGLCEDQSVEPNSAGAYAGTTEQLMGNGFSTRDGGTGVMVRPLPPRQDCGNYYNAPDQGRLQLVFDDIASRMFTRLAP